MVEATPNVIHVLVAADFTDEQIRQFRAVSDKLQIEHHFPDVPESAYGKAEVLYTISNFPTPAQAPNLRWIQVHYAGVERVINKPIIQETDVTLTSASGIHVVQMAEYCLAMMLSFMYKIPRMIALKSEVKWPEHPSEIFSPHGLRGTTLGIIGYGSIGRELARIVNQMGVTVLTTKRDAMNPADHEHYTPDGMGDPEGDIPERIYPPEALESMVEECDFVVVTVPLTDNTHHVVNEQVFNRMKKSAVLINVARGGVVDQEALVKALKSKKIAGVALDVFEPEPLPEDSPLWKMENVIISPHISGNTSQYHQKAAALFEQNLRRYVEKKPLYNVVKREQGY